MGSDSGSGIDLSLISVDYQSLEKYQKANLFTFLKKNEFVTAASEIDQKLLCLATDLSVEELSEALEIEKQKFGKARGPRIEEKYKYI